MAESQSVTTPTRAEMGKGQEWKTFLIRWLNQSCQVYAKKNLLILLTAEILSPMLSVKLVNVSPARKVGRWRCMTRIRESKERVFG